MMFPPQYRGNMMSRFAMGLRALSLLGWALLLSGCTGRETPVLAPAAGQTTASGLVVEPREQRLAGPPIRIAMSAAFVSESGVGVYAKLADWLSGQLGRQVEFVSGLSYGTLSEMSDDGAVEVAFICGYPYVLKRIASKDRDRIFQVFERAVRGTNISGFGLGLYVTRQIVQAHGGSIQVEDTPGGGTTFVVELPVDSGSPTGPAGPRRQPGLESSEETQATC